MNKVAYKERTWQRWIYGLNPQLRRQTFNAKFLTADDNRLIIFKQSEVVGILLDVVCLVEKGLNRTRCDSVYTIPSQLLLFFAPVLG